MPEISLQSGPGTPLSQQKGLLRVTGIFTRGTDDVSLLYDLLIFIGDLVVYVSGKICMV